MTTGSHDVHLLVYHNSREVVKIREPSSYGTFGLGRTFILTLAKDDRVEVRKLGGDLAGGSAGFEFSGILL